MKWLTDTQRDTAREIAFEAGDSRRGMLHWASIKGAFTGAVARRLGKFEEANGGTLLLDEISEMDVRLQAKLLRAIQEKEPSYLFKI